MRFFWQKERELSPLEQLVASVDGQHDVYEHDYAVALANPNRERDMHELAIDGVAHHVFNTLRGAEDGIPEGSFEDVRAIVAEAFRA